MQRHVLYDAAMLEAAILPNTSLPFMSSLDECIVCPPGTSCSVGAATPIDCLPGSYAANASQATCTLCDGSGGPRFDASRASTPPVSSEAPAMMASEARRFNL